MELANITWDKLEGLPEGLTVDEPLQAEFLGLFNNSELTPAQRASQLLTLHGRMMEQGVASLTAEWEAEQAQWRQEAAALPEFAGRPKAEALADIARVVNRYGTAELRDVLNKTGVGNHPEVVRMFLKLAKDLNEEAPVQGDPPPAPQLTREQRLYGIKG